MTALPIRLVLDASAVLEYTRGSIHVGEVLTQVEDDNAVAVVPSLSLAAVFRSITDSDRLDVLFTLPFVAVIGEDGAQWRALAALYDVTGRLDAAACALAAIDAGAAVLTAQPGLYAGLGGNLAILIGE